VVRPVGIFLLGICLHGITSCLRYEYEWMFAVYRLLYAISVLIKCMRVVYFDECTCHVYQKGMRVIFVDVVVSNVDVQE